jgi:AP-1-like factor
MNPISSWPTPTPPSQDTSLDDLFAGYLNPNQNADFSFASTPSISPIVHPTPANFANLNNSHLNSLLQQKRSPNTSRTSSVPSPSSQSTASSEPLLGTPKDASGSPSFDHSVSPNDPNIDPTHDAKSQGCPLTRSALIQRIADAGASPFAPVGLQKTSELNAGPVVSCAGSKFPRTTLSDKNVEVLKAWRSITSNPAFKVSFDQLVSLIVI